MWLIQWIPLRVCFRISVTTSITTSVSATLRRHELIEGLLRHLRSLDKAKQVVEQGRILGNIDLEAAKQQRHILNSDRLQIICDDLGILLKLPGKTDIAIMISLKGDELMDAINGQLAKTKCLPVYWTEPSTSELPQPHSVHTSSPSHH